MTLLKNGITDLNTGNRDHLNLARDQLVDLAKRVRPRVNTNDYVDLRRARPGSPRRGRATWSTPSTTCPRARAPTSCATGPARRQGPGQQRPDRAAGLGPQPGPRHLFLNHLLDYDVAVKNMSWNGYQPPQTKLNPTSLVDQELLPADLKTATVLPEQFDRGYRLLELAPEVDDLWHAAWQEFKAGA